MKELKVKKWSIAEADAEILEKLKQELHINDIVARLLYNRNIRNVDKARDFLYAGLDKLHSPFLLKDMNLAVKYILDAIDKNKKIVVYGDYDVDGITSTSLLYRALKRLNANVGYYIPERQKEGYGLNKEALEQLVEEQNDLVITVDCGISSAELIAEFKDKIDIIVTDHHTPPDLVPECVAVINPKQTDCEYPDDNLAGVGVAFKLCQALWETARDEIYLEDLDIVALGTIADLVPLLGENRILVTKGLEKINDNPNLGLASLFEVIGLEDKAITSGHIGFMVAPRLNAAGRVTHAEEGVKLLTAKYPEDAITIAEHLHEINTKRQEIERGIVQIAREQVLEQGEKADKVIVVSGENWHQGVVGIVASRLVEEFYKPTLVISVSNGIGKGSCRSISGVNIYDALKSVSDILIQFGGHKQAAGFSIKEENIPILRERLVEYCKENVKESDYIPTVKIDYLLSEEEVAIDTVEELSILEPYGMKNSTPVFAMSNTPIGRVFCMGKAKQHIKFTLDLKNQDVDALVWFGADYQKEFYPGDYIKLAFTLGINEWRDVRKPQLTIQDIQPMEKREINITVEELREIYSEIKRIFKRESLPEHIVVAEAIRSCGIKDNPKKWIIALEIFKELGIIEVIKQEAEPDLYRWCAVKRKLELDTSVTFLKYSS